MLEPSVNDQYLEMFVFESSQMIEQLETVILNCEKVSAFTPEAINEIFRIMHSIKSSSAMMGFVDLSALSHAIEDLFSFLREEKPQYMDFKVLCNLIFDGLDFIKVEIHKIKNGENADGNATDLIESINAYLKKLKILFHRMKCRRHN